MEKRINLAKTQPLANKAMYGLVDYLATSSISKGIRQLVKIRASQINGCAFCLELNTPPTLKAGITLDKLILLNAWRESAVFSVEERVALALAEEITLIHRRGVSDEAYRQALSAFGEEGVAQLIMEVVAINAWNRIAIATRMELKDQ